MLGLCCISSSSWWRNADASCVCEACHEQPQRLGRLGHAQKLQETQDLLHILKEKTKNFGMVATDGTRHLIHIYVHHRAWDAQQENLQRAPEDVCEKGAAPALPSLKHENAEGDFFLHDEKRKCMKSFDMKRNFPAPCAPAVRQVLLLSETSICWGGDGSRRRSTSGARASPASPAHPSLGRN